MAAPPSERWLEAHRDPLADIYTFSSCVALSDLTGQIFAPSWECGVEKIFSGDGDNRLVVADLGTGDFNMKLRVYKGTQQVTENTIIDLPTGVVTFHMDTTEPRIPAIAVASAAHIYIYKVRAVGWSQVSMPMPMWPLFVVSHLQHSMISHKYEKLDNQPDI